MAALRCQPACMAGQRGIRQRDCDGVADVSQKIAEKLLINIGLYISCQAVAYRAGQNTLEAVFRTALAIQPLLFYKIGYRAGKQVATGFSGGKALADLCCGDIIQRCVGQEYFTRRLLMQFVCRAGPVGI